MFNDCLKDLLVFMLIIGVLTALHIMPFSCFIILLEVCGIVSIIELLLSNLG